MTTYGRPEWLITGWVEGNTYCILASNRLSEAELNMKADERQIDYRNLRHVMTSYSHSLTTWMDTYVIIQAPSYEQCLAELFKTWNPVPDLPAIEAGKPEITP